MAKGNMTIGRSSNRTQQQSDANLAMRIEMLLSNRMRK